MRVLGLDIGEKRVGVAVSDTTRRVATPAACLDAGALRRDGRALVRIIDDYEVGRVVIGLPLSLDGTEGPQALRVRRFVEALSPFLGVPVEFVDERYTSTEAGRRMREAGVSERAQRGSKDMVAAAILLQAYLDRNAATRLDAGCDAPAEDVLE